MHDVFTPQSLVDFLYFNPQNTCDEETFNHIFQDEYLLTLFEKEAEAMLSLSGKSCEPSEKALIAISQFSATRVFNLDHVNGRLYNS